MFVFSITWPRRSNAVSIKSSPPIQGVKNEGMLEPMSAVSAYASYLRHIWKLLFSMEDLEHGRIKCVLFFFLYILSSWDMTGDPALFSTYARAIQVIFKFIYCSLDGNTFETTNYRVCVFVCTHAQSCLTLHDPMDCSPPGASVHEIFQAKILEWGAISYSRGSSQPKDWTCVCFVSCIGRRILYH